VNFLAIDQTLRAVLNAVSGLPVALAQDDGQSQFFAQVGTGAVTDGHGNSLGTGNNKQASVTYDILSILGVGWDEWRTRYDVNVKPAGDTYPGSLGSIITENTGNRELHIQVKVESFDARDGLGPLPIIERIRTAFPLPSVLELLNDAGLALQGVGATTLTSYDDDNGRRVNVAIVDVVFNGADGIEDLPVTTIEQLDLAGITVLGLVTDT
jgi:hypothetical protein